GLTNQKLSASTITRWVISQESAEHLEVRKENYRQGSKAEEKTPKALMAIDGVGWDWSYMANEGEDHALVADVEAPIEFALMANTKIKFMDVEVEKDDLNQKFLTSLAPEWLMHTIVWTNRNDQDTMRLDDLYNHLKHNSGDKDGNTACVSTSSTTFPTASASVATISQDTASAYIASQSNGSHIKFKDINQIDEDDIEEMDIKWSMALLSMRADKF
nr:hypothetical protein [Tanacetum cinerariifolium]